MQNNIILFRYRHRWDLPAYGRDKPAKYPCHGLEGRNTLALFLHWDYHLNMHSSNSIQHIKKELGNQQAVERCAEQFGLVGDATRMKICWLLCKHKELSVSEIAKMLDVSISVVSHSLGRLRRYQMVQSRRAHKQVFYSLSHTSFNHLLKKSLINL